MGLRLLQISACQEEQVGPIQLSTLTRFVWFPKAGSIYRHTAYPCNFGGCPSPSSPMNLLPKNQASRLSEENA